MSLPAIALSVALAFSLGLVGCASSGASSQTDKKDSESLQVSDTPSAKGSNASDAVELPASKGKPVETGEDDEKKSSDKDEDKESDSSRSDGGSSDKVESSKEAKAALDLTEDYSHKQFVHGDKPAKFQKYIVLHDTEGEGSAKSVISSWAANGNLIAAHFVVNRDGSVVQCVPLDKIAHHAGYGNPGKNKKYGVSDESRDDKLGPRKATKSLPDYGMNSYSVGIEMVHVTGGKDYTEAQLDAVDKLIAYIDTYYGFESTIIDHKAWRAGNSDTSAAFAGYLKNYQDHRTHK